MERLRLMEGEPGRTVYAHGVARFERAHQIVEVRPPFGIEEQSEYDRIRVSPLVEELERDHLVAVLLVRLGGYAAAVLDGESIVASKVGTRLVHGRHRAGGSSSNRFRRRRENEMRDLHRAAAEVAVRILVPWLGRVERAALGGDRTAVRETIAARPELAALVPIALERFFTVPDPRLAVVRSLPYDLYAAEVTETER